MSDSIRIGRLVYRADDVVTASDVVCAVEDKFVFELPDGRLSTRALSEAQYQAIASAWPVDWAEVTDALAHPGVHEPGMVEFAKAIIGLLPA